MGAGKSTLGPLIARPLGALFVDLDVFVEQQQGLTVPQLFAEKGEPFFRRAESQALRTVLEQRGRLVLSVGGGCFTQSRNRELLHQKGAATIFLEAPAEELWSRCQAQTGNTLRPLLNNETSFRQLYMQRLPQYRLALYTVQAGGRPPELIAEEILDLMRRTRGIHQHKEESK